MNSATIFVSYVDDSSVPNLSNPPTDNGPDRILTSLQTGTPVHPLTDSTSEPKKGNVVLDSDCICIILPPCTLYNVLIVAIMIFLCGIELYSVDVSYNPMAQVWTNTVQYDIQARIYYV